jgi:hypothetical protein
VLVPVITHFLDVQRPLLTKSASAPQSVVTLKYSTKLSLISGYILASEVSRWVSEATNANETPYVVSQKFFGGRFSARLPRRRKSEIC